MLGGILGAAIGIVAAIAVGSIAQWPVIVDLSAILLAIGFAAAVGVFFGYYPARKAASLQPIESLRAE
ncbi:MAG: hypothetical protein EOS85_06875 [Mesorhizobium sp.]|nr:MAG: hypothetical protein EOS85_06875 [Mesorhizobium sp.]